MGQMLDRFSSVSEEKKNKEIERIVGEVYKKYLEKPKTEKSLEKSIDNPEPSKKPEGNPEPSKKSEGNPEPSKKPEVNPEPSKKPEENPEPSKKPEVNPEPSKKPEENPEISKKPDEANTSKYKAKFYRAVCEIVGELNKTFGNTQFKVPSIENLNKAFEEHHRTAEPVTKGEFQGMLQYILKTESGFTGFGAKDALVYIFTVPAAAALAKQRLFPRAIPNDVLIPGVTSATVYALAKLNKI